MLSAGVGACVSDVRRKVASHAFSEKGVEASHLRGLFSDTHVGWEMTRETAQTEDQDE